MAEPERVSVVYVTQNGKDWLKVSLPTGLVPPPSIELHKPLSGPVVFWYAECWGIPIPAAALADDVT